MGVFDIIPKVELLKIINEVIMFNAEEMDDEQYLTTLTREELWESYVKTLLQWQSHMCVYQDLEEYEICHLIKKVLEIQKENVTRMFDVKWGLHEQDIENIELLYKESREEVQNLWEEEKRTL